MIAKTFRIILITALISVYQLLTAQTCEVDGGIISTNSSTVVCSGDGEVDLIDITLVQESGQFSGWIITNEQGDILDLPTSPPFNLDETFTGVSLVYHISYENDLSGLQTGNNLSILTGCYDLSNPVSFVSKEVDGGIIYDEDLTTVNTICLNSGIGSVINLTLIDEVGQSGTWIVTDENGYIDEMLPNPPFDFNGEEPGISYIYHVSYDGISGLSVGNNISELDGCYDFSNEYKVNKLFGNPTGGTINTSDPTEICSGDGQPDLFTIIISGNSQENNQIVVTNKEGIITMLPTNNTFNLEGSQNDTSYIYNLSYVSGTSGINQGFNINDLKGCYDLSNEILISTSYVRGGKLIDESGQSMRSICSMDGSADDFSIFPSNFSGELSRLVLTDSTGLIIELTASNNISFDDRSSGIYYFYNIIYNNSDPGIITGINIEDLNGCFDLSEPYKVTVATGNVNGGTISTTDDTFVCSGDINSDLISVDLAGSGNNNSAWLITDINGSIVEIPSSPPFDFSNIALATCYIYHVDYITGIANLEEGKNISDLEGCYSLSNSIEVNKTIVKGGEIHYAGGDTIMAICVDDNNSDILNIVIAGEIGANQKWIILDQSGNILSITDQITMDFDDSDPGVNHILHISYDGVLEGLSEGSKLSDLSGCYNTSNTIILNKSTGVTQPASIATTDPLDICISNEETQSIRVSEIPGVGDNSLWVVTNASGEIIVIQENKTFNVTTFPIGSCTIRNIRFQDGLVGLEVGNNLNNISGCYSLSNEITVNKTASEGGILSFQNNENDEQIYCLNASEGVIRVNVEGDFGSNSTFIVTNASGSILEFNNTAFFEFDGEPQGIRLLWHIRYEDGIEGLSIGQNINLIRGCYGLSNPLTVNLEQVNGGQIITTSGLTTVELCAGEGVNDLVEVELSNVVGSMRSWVLTDNRGNIVDLPTGPVFNFEDPNSGVFQLRNINFAENITNFEIGNNIADIEGCFDFSNAIIVDKSAVVGGSLSIKDDGTGITVCTGNNEPDIVSLELVDNKGLNQTYILTTPQGMILEVFTANDKDFEDFQRGTFYIYSVSYFEIEGLDIDANMSDLTGCYSVSNRVVVNTKRPEGGILTDDNDNNEIEICVGDGVEELINIRLFDNEGQNGGWIITSEDGLIQDINSTPPFNLEFAGGGMSNIYYISYENGLIGKSVGENIANLQGCFSLSNPLTVKRNAVNGGEITTKDTSLVKNICIDDDYKYDIEVNIENETGENMSWFITDTNGVIQETDLTPPFNFEDEEEGACDIWHISYSGSLPALIPGDTITNLSGCFHLSNNIRINKLAGEGCITSTIEIEGNIYNIDLYPNPTTDYLFIKSDLPSYNGFKISIMNLNGQEIKSVNADKMDQGIRVSELSPGIYFVALNGRKNTQLLKFIKQ